MSRTPDVGPIREAEGTITSDTTYKRMSRPFNPVDASQLTRVKSVTI